MHTPSQMQEYGCETSNKLGEYREGEEGDRSQEFVQETFHSQHQYAIQKSYGCSNRDSSDPNITTYSRVITGTYETSTTQQFQNSRYKKPSAPTFSSPPNSPLVGLFFDPSSPNLSGSSVMAERLNSDRRSQSTWSISHQEPIGTGAKKKIVKSQDKRNPYGADPRYQDKFKDSTSETDRSRNKERTLTSESTSSLDFYTEGEKMVSELCNISESNSRNNISSQKSNHKVLSNDDDKNKPTVSSDILLTALDKIIIHDQIPNQIVQLAIEACTDAENIAIAHHNRPCFKNIHSICAKTRSNVQKPDSAVANLHSQGIPWVIKNFIFSFVRILDGWKGVKELLSEKHDTFSRIENKYYSQNIRECFVQWQAVTKEMLTHIYKTFKCLDHGFTMEQKSFTHNYYATNSAAPRHQNQNKFQAGKAHVSTPRPINASPQPFNVMQPPWIQNQTSTVPQNYSDSSWPARSSMNYKKIPSCVPLPNSQNFFSVNDQSDVETYPKSQYKCDPCNMRESKPRQSWTITNVPDFRALDGICHADQRDLYVQLKHKMDAELGKTPGHATITNVPCDLLHRREMELKAKMIPLSHVEKTLIPSMASTADIRSCYVQKNNSCGDTKEEADFFAAWGQMVQKESNDFSTHHTHNIQIPSNVVISSNISGPVQFIDLENDEFHEMSKVYMKPGSYKVPIKPADSISSFSQNSSQDVYENHQSSIEDTTSVKVKVPFLPITLAPQPKYNIESWPCLMSRRAEELFTNDQKLLPKQSVPCLDMRGVESLEILSSMTSDRAWEAAKQSAPKLMDFIHDGSKSDTARLYDALGLTANEEFSDDLKQNKFNFGSVDAWSTVPPPSSHSKQDASVWDQASKEYSLNDSQGIIEPRSMSKIGLDEHRKSPETDEQIETEFNKCEEFKPNARCPNFDQSGNIKDENKKKSSGKSKATVSGTWYHPKKKKPLPNNIVKKFESIIFHLLQINEAAFIEQDMDIKVAPRFYEVVKYPMSLNDISTKLKNSSYTEFDQVVQDFRRIFNNVRLYLKTYPDSTMKKNLSKVSTEFEKILSEEFHNKCDSKSKSCDNATRDTNKKMEKECVANKSDGKKEEVKNDTKIYEDNK